MDLRRFEDPKQIMSNLLESGNLSRIGPKIKKYYIFLNLGPDAGPVQANITALQLPIIETRTEVLLALARAKAQTYELQTDFVLVSILS